MTAYLTRSLLCLYVTGYQESKVLPMRSTPPPPELLVRFETAGGQRTLLYPCKFSVLVSTIDVGQTERDVVSL